MTHRVGIVGLGTVGRRFVEQYQKHPGFELAAVWDVHPAARTAAQRAFGAPVLNTLEELLEGSDLDLVYLATPPGTHRPLVESVVDAGIAVFCEKPLGVDEADSRAIADLVAGASVPSAVNFVFGAAPGAVEMVRAVRAGDLGTLAGFDLRLHFARWPRDWQAAATWLALRAEGGFTREVISHFVFQILRVQESVDLVWSRPRWPADPTAAETTIHAELDAGGVPVSIVATSGGVGPDTVELAARGDRSSLRLTDWYRLERAPTDGPWLGDETPFAELAAGAYAAQLDAVAAMVEGRPHSLASFREALQVQLLVEKLLDSPPET